MVFQPYLCLPANVAKRNPLGLWVPRYSLNDTET